MGGNRNNQSIEEKVVERPRGRALEDRATQGREAALDDERAVAQGRAADVRRITRGRFPYNDWLAQKFNCRSEVSLAEENYNKISEELNEEVSVEPIKEDARALHKIVDDIERDIRRAMDAGEVLSNEEIDRLMDRLWVCDQAKSVLIQSNKSIDIARSIGVFSLIGGFIALGIYGNFALFRHRMAQLHELMENARRRTNSSTVKMVLNGTISAITIAFPHLGLATRGGLLVGQLLMNELLGDQSAGSQMRTTAGLVADAYDELERVASRKKVIARTASSKITIVGLAFDIQEVEGRLEEEEDIWQMMHAVDKEFKEEILPKIAIMKKNLNTLTEEIIPELRMKLAQNKLNVGAAREELASRIQQTGYQR